MGPGALPVLQSCVAVPDLLVQLCFVEPVGPVGLSGLRWRGPEAFVGGIYRGAALPDVPGVRVGLGGLQVEDRCHSGAAAGVALPGGVGELDRLGVQVEVLGLAGHEPEDVGPDGSVAGRMGRPQGCEPVALGL